MTQQKLNDNLIQRLRAAKDAVMNMNWQLTSEGPAFWEDVYSRIRNKAHHGTTDGKPWVEPELTDEDAKQRPWVMVRDAITQDWKGPLILIGILPSSNYVCRVSSVSVWSQCRRATPEEIEAANVR
jgi:hypothetical protein